MKKNIDLNDIAHFMGIITNYRMMSEELEKEENSGNSRTIKNKKQ